MNKPTSSLLVLTYVCGVFSKITPYVGDFIFPTHLPISASCMTTITTAKQTCKKQATEYWQGINSALAREFTDALGSGDHVKAKQLAQQVSCCEAYSNIDCILFALSDCTVADEKAAKVAFQISIQQLQSKSCTKYKYQSDQCINEVQKATSTPSSGDDILPTSLPITDDCKTKVQSSVDNCKDKIGDKWLKSDLTKQFRDALAKKDTGKMTDLEHHIKCCMSWEAYDCVEHALGMCSSNDQKSTKDRFDDLVEQKEVSFCASYKYHSYQCGSGAGSISANMIKVTLFVFGIFVYSMN